MSEVHFLLVDDLDENLVALEAILRREGLVLLKARSGTEALELLLQHEVALTLIDVQMPEMDGFELAEFMRGSERTRRIPIIFLTAGLADLQRRFRGYEAGAVDFLQKPLEPDILRSKAEVFFELYRQRQEVARQRDELRAVAQENARLLDESRRNAEALRESEERLRMALSSGELGDWSLDVATDLLTLSHRGAAIFGLGGEGVFPVGAVRELLHPDDAERVRREFDEALLAGGDYAAEYRIRRANDGAEIWVSAHGRARFGDDARLLGMIGIVQDITSRKRYEDALRDQGRRKDEFLATLAHELRNPLAPIRTGLQLLKLSPPGGSVAAEAQVMMERQLSHLVRLVDDLLDVSRISRGKIDLKKERIRAEAVLDHAVEVSRPLIEGAGHSLTMQRPDPEVWLDGDLTRLAQVVSNLLNNAAKYTPEGGRISLVVRSTDDEILFQVADNGIGIPVEMLPRIFDLFTQVDPGSNRAQGGLGIGLSLVKKLVEMHGGRIEAHSAGSGQGSSFAVYLPRAESPEQTVDSTPPASESVQVNRQTFLRVLIVDDNVDGANSLGMLLSMAGHSVRIAHDGPSALQVAHAFHPELVFLDIGLPGLDGYQVCRNLRADSELHKTTIVAVTGWGTVADKKLAEEAGFDLHLVKPVEPEAVKAVVSNHKSRREHACSNDELVGNSC